MDLTYAPVGSSIVSDDSSTKKKKAGFFKRGISSQESASQDGLAQPVEAKTGLFAPKPAKAHYRYGGVPPPKLKAAPSPSLSLTPSRASDISARGQLPRESLAEPNEATSPSPGRGSVTEPTRPHASSATVAAVFVAAQPASPPRIDSSLGFNSNSTFNLDFPHTTARKRASLESTTSSVKTSASSLWPAASHASSQASPASSAPSIMSIKDLRLIQEDPVPVFPRTTQVSFDSATRNLNKVLGLSLSYLVAIDLSQLPHLPPLILLSSTGPTETTGPLDPKLHFEGLRAPEKGILYQRSRALTLQYGHHSGLLVPVTEVADVGYLLCGFTDEPTRNFDDRDVRYFKRFATELEKWVVKTG